MGVKQRREREKVATRQAIITASRQIVRQQGWGALTIRKVAEQIEYSPSMIYEYFASKEEILLALLREGAQELTEAMKKASLATEDPEARLYLIGDAFWEFARNSPDLYQVMHGQGGIPLDANAVAQSVEEVITTTHQVLMAWANAEKVTLPDELGAIEIVWSVLHGLVSLSIVGRLPEDRAQQLLHQVIHDLLVAWRVNARHS